MTTPTEPQGRPADTAIGRSVARLRMEREWTQQELAGMMRDRGWAWTQQVLVKVEKGTRPLRFAEANDLAALFRVTTQDLAASPTEHAFRDARIEQAQSRGALARSSARVSILDAVLRARAGADVSVGTHPETDLLTAFRMPHYPWAQTLSIFEDLGASKSDTARLEALYMEAIRPNANSLPLGQGMWELLQRLVPTLHSDEE